MTHSDGEGCPTTVDDYRDRLSRAGWSLGEFGHVNSWTVEAAKGQRRILATAPTQTEAWRWAWMRADAYGPARRD